MTSTYATKTDFISGELHRDDVEPGFDFDALFDRLRDAGVIEYYQGDLLDNGARWANSAGFRWVPGKDPSSEDYDPDTVDLIDRLVEELDLAAKPDSSQNIVDRLNDYSGENIWDDIIRTYDVDEEATEHLDPSGASDVFQLNDGRRFRWEPSSDEWSLYEI